ncbi:Protein GrpE [Buchnera aphidicola (Cinara cuneomaculata)]|uniref:Protein GrpE n=1 Tax=Buchnera aphidicola (Cinara cuneomaculata) TaxID=1660040 RepID=A0A451CYB6_9GAMM|nr:nucleotide exchange factor GrpE [Buchnera aphidicola]VFP78153.1 Protein GrpE [Buchnera aphidicola (Cinara cuneomaculata)]
MKCNNSLDKLSSNRINQDKNNKDIENYEEFLQQKKLKKLHLQQDIINDSKYYADKLLNFEVRLHKKINNTYNFFLEKYFLSILPVVDSIDASVHLLESSNKNNSEIYVYLKDIQKKFIYLFSKYKISIINAIDIPFNPEFHQAISIDFSGKYKNNYISYVIQPGYSINNRLLRPALVSVSQIK